MQILIADKNDPTKKVWVSVKCSGTTIPYRYDTKEEAEKMLRMCYGAALPNNEMRIKEI